jgi:hypothetical protein
MMKLIGSVLAGLALAGLAVGAVVAVDNGTVNGRDLSTWPGGNDNPDGLTGSYAYYSVTHNALLKEWLEPDNDRYRDENMYFPAAAEQKLNNETNTRFLTFEQNIQHQDYYNLAGCCYTTNLPHTNNPTADGWFEEWQQGYSETEMELRDVYLINTGVYYYLDIEWDSQTAATSSGPKFWTELEWELKACCDPDIRFDQTGEFKKNVLQ